MPALRKYEWPDIVKTVRLCRAENGNAAPTRLAVETIIGGGDTLRLDIAIRAVEAEHGHRPEYLDTLPDQILRHLKDPRKEGGLLPIPEAIKARLREPFLSALITIASAVLAELEQGAQNATILVTDTERDLGGRLKDATDKARDDADAIAQLKKENAQLTQDRDNATSRAVAAEAARDALVLSAKGIAELKAEVRKAIKAKAIPAATAGVSRMRKVPRKRKAPMRR